MKERNLTNCFCVEFKKLHFAEAILVTIVRIKRTKEQIHYSFNNVNLEFML